MMATEALLDLRPRSDAARAHVESQNAQTNAAALPADERASMIGALRWLASIPYPAVGGVANTVGQLEMYVSDLLTAPFPGAAK